MSDRYLTCDTPAQGDEADDPPGICIWWMWILASIFPHWYSRFGADVRFIEYIRGDGVLVKAC